LIALGRDLGLPFFQLNTNGLHIPSEKGYAEKLAAAGLDTVFLEFDGLSGAAHFVLCGRPLRAVKERAIERCAVAGLGVVLAPTVVPGVNLDQLGHILDFALARLPAVRANPCAATGANREVSRLGQRGCSARDATRRHERACRSEPRSPVEDLPPGDCEPCSPCRIAAEDLADGRQVLLRMRVIQESLRPARLRTWLVGRSLEMVEFAAVNVSRSSQYRRRGASSNPPLTGKPGEPILIQ
jgi:hypothetical protein